MKDIWRVKYQKAVEMSDPDPVRVLTGFNANIDVTYDLNDVDLELNSVEKRDLDSVSSMGDLKSVLKFCCENGVNREVKRDNFSENIPGDGEQKLGGQGGIMANFLSKMNNNVIFYTPLLSDELASLINNRVEVPTFDGRIALTRAKDAVNTDRTKKNSIIEFDGEKTGRLIISDGLKGFGPYFRKGIEENFKKIDDKLDRIILSGFHNAEGNFETKLEKSKMQLEKIETPKHLEYVSMADEKAEEIINSILPSFESVGMDEEEAKQVARFLNIDTADEVSLIDAFKISKKLIDEKGLDRVHVHTYRYHVTVVSDYPVESEKIRRSMLLSEVAAMRLAQTGELPTEDSLDKFEIHGKHLYRLDELENFKNKYEIENFVEEGIAEIDGFRVTAIPTMIHEDPKRLVGMGDVISSAAFVGEEN